MGQNVFPLPAAKPPYGSGKYTGSFSTNSLTLVTALSISGAGRVNLLKIGSASCGSLITIIIDGVTIVNNQAITAAAQWINALGAVQTSMTSPLDAMLSFENSITIQIACSSTGSSPLVWQYELF